MMTINKLLPAKYTGVVVSKFPTLKKPMNLTEATGKAKNYRESHIRTMLKTISWRILATTTTILIAYFVFQDASRALAVGGIEFFAKMIIYYVHERAWQLVPRGSIRTWFART